jgi:peptidoglycan/xylan/chitin deacetylase (PgdA/CDA1 family)
MLDKGTAWARGLAQRVRGRLTLQNGPLILLYHRVAPVSADPWALNVTPSHFAEHLKVLSGSGANIVPLSRIAQAIRENDQEFLKPRRGTPRPIALTFDDGYADNLYQAKPLLEQYDAPATVFVATDNVNSGAPFWIDTLEKVFLGKHPLPEELDLSVSGRRFLRKLGTETAPTGSWRAWERPRTTREALYVELYETLVRFPDAERRTATTALWEWAGLDESTLQKEQHPLTAAEVKQLAAGELVDIGAHTVTHPCLAARTLTEQREEINRGRAEITALTGRVPTAFAYPYGRPALDYTPDTVALVREAGFDCACSNFSGPTSKGSAAYELPRIQVQDWNGTEFACRLCL